MGHFTAALTNVQAIGWLRLIPLLPLVGAIINGVFGAILQRTSKRLVHAVAVGCMLGAAAVAIAAVATLLRLPPHERYLWDRVFPMIHLGRLQVDFALAVDPLSAVMILVITVVGTLIHVYAIGYMAKDAAYWRFFAYLNLFVSAMLLLVLGDSFVTLFFGWEGVGLCSYLLIGFWWHESRNASAGLKAFVVNRVGDFGFLAGVLVLFWALGGSWSRIDHRYYPDDAAGRAAEVPVVVTDEPEANAAAASLAHRGARHALVTVAPTLVLRELHDQLAVTGEHGERPLADALVQKRLWGAPVVLVVALLLFLGVCGKSAQIPLYVWLPDAMAGPTPVSALIHAATMVTAGVYLIARLNFLFALSPAAMTAIACVGAATALGAAIIGLFQYDIKRVLAYSTISQLGFMFVGVGVGAWWAGVFHLVTHALFKACLFLGAGSVIHGMHALTHARAHALDLDEDNASEATGEHSLERGDDEHKPARLDPRLAPDPTDPQDMRNMGGLGALMPVTRATYLVACWAIAGFPWAAGFFSKDEILAQAFARSPALWLVGLVAAACTSFYMFRSYYLTFEARPTSAAHRRHVHESPRVMTGVLVALAAATLVMGPLVGLPRLWSGHEPIVSRWLEPVTSVSRAWLPVVAERRGVELALMLASVGAATLGWFGARALYKNAEVRDRVAAVLAPRFAALHAFAFDKFRVDELYEATFVRGFVASSRAAAWLDAHVVDAIVDGFGATARLAAALSGAIDRYLVDGAVDAVAGALLGGGRALRRLQTGRLNHYVLGVALGIVLLIVLVSGL